MKVDREWIDREIVNTQRENARNEFDKNHKRCPVCLNNRILQNLSAAREWVDENGQWRYEDRNKCECFKCGHVCRVTDLLPKF